jgi:hypothetical protein
MSASNATNRGTTYNEWYERKQKKKTHYLVVASRVLEEDWRGEGVCCVTGGKFGWNKGKWMGYFDEEKQEQEE